MRNKWLNHNHSEIRTVEELLKAIDRGEYDIFKLSLVPEELERYSDCLLKAGLVTIARNDGDTGYLHATAIGKTLLGLIRKLDTLTDISMPKKADEVFVRKSRALSQT
jgi:hypothetical protein